MKKLTQKLVLSVITMALVVVALGTSTFAWFTLTNTATTQAFQANVTSGEGIEISLGTWDTVEGKAIIDDDSTWYTVLPTTAINARLSEVYTSGIKLVDLTSATGASVVSRLGATPALGQYISLDLFFRSSDTGMVVKLSSLNIGGQSDEWTVDVPSFVAANGETYTVGQTMTVAAWAAARVSIKHGIDYGTAATTVVFQGQEFNYIDGTSDAYLDTFNSVALPAVSYVSNSEVGAASYWIAKGNSALTAGTIPNATQVSGAIPTLSQPTVVTLSTPSTQPASGTYDYGHIVLQVWIEGWDADAYDSVFRLPLSVQLAFVGA